MTQVKPILKWTNSNNEAINNLSPQQLIPECVHDTWEQYKGLEPQAAGGDNQLTISGVIGIDVSLALVQHVLRKVGPKGAVSVDINSPGGFFFDGVAIYNALARHKGEVTVNVLGFAGSAAQVITMAGDKVYMGDGAQQFIHNSWVITLGNRHEMRAVAAELERIDNDMAKLISRRTRLTEAESHELMDADSYLNADEAIDIGLADGYINNASGKSSGHSNANMDSTHMVALADGLAGLERNLREGI